MKRVLDFLFPPDPPHDSMTRAVQQAENSLEQIRVEHERATKRADRAMQASVDIARKALRRADRH